MEAGVSNKRDPSSKDLVFKFAGEHMGEGDTNLVLDIIPPELAQVAFENLRREVAWNVMKHHGLSDSNYVLTKHSILHFRW